MTRDRAQENLAIGRNATVHFQPGTRFLHIGPGDPDANSLVFPGFIDLQVNGVDEIDFGIAHNEHSIAEALDRMTRHGTTGCLPTIVTAPLVQYDAMLERVRRARDLPDADRRCAILGVHLEGPFLGGAPGAHPKHLLRDVELTWLTELVDRHDDLIKMVTISPERDPGFEAIKFLTARGVLVALGHSDCSYETALRATDAGARAVTHLYNGMSGLHHRSPGLATAALLDDRLTPTMIGDLHHVSAPALRVAMAVKERIALITDAVAPGAGESGGMKIEQRGGAVFLADGTMAGAVIHMDDAVRNIWELLMVDVNRLSAMAAGNAARLLRLHDRGFLRTAARADLTVVNADTFHVEAVWIDGRLVHSDR